MLIQINIPIKRIKLSGQEVMQKHASFPGVGTHSVVRGRTRSPHRQQIRESGEVPTVTMEHMYSPRKETSLACSQQGNRSSGTWVRRRPRVSNREPQESRESVDADVHVDEDVDVAADVDVQVGLGEGAGVVQMLCTCTCTCTCTCV